MSSISGFPLCPIETSRGNRKWTRILSKCLTNRVNTIMNLRSLQVTEIYFSVCKRSVFKEIFDDSSEFHLLCLRIWIATDEMLYYFPWLRLYNSLSMRSWRLTRTQNWIRKGIRQSKGFTNRKFMLKQHNGDVLILWFVCIHKLLKEKKSFSVTSYATLSTIG